MKTLPYCEKTWKDFCFYLKLCNKKKMNMNKYIAMEKKLIDHF